MSMFLGELYLAQPSSSLVTFESFVAMSVHILFF